MTKISRWARLSACIVVCITVAGPVTVSLAGRSGSMETRPDSAVRLTTPPAGMSDQNPAFSPDDGLLVFTRFETGYNSGPAGLFLLNPESGEPYRLTAWEDQDNVNLPGSCWNDVNNRMVFASDRLESDDIWRVAPDGTDFTRITSHSGPPWYIEPSWSPEGDWIVFEADNDVPDDQQQGSIWKVRSDGTDVTVLTDGPGGGTDDRQPNWSPAGDLILFQRHVPGSDDWNVWTMYPDGSHLMQVTTSPSSDTDASWSSDGNWIVYSSDHGGLSVPNIFVISRDGSEVIRVTEDDSNEDGAPSWSHDGQWITFESHPGQEEETPSSLWRISVPGFPSPTPKPCETTGVTLEMPSNYYRPGEACYCSVTVCNVTGTVLHGHPLFAILDIFGSYFFAPGFDEFDYYDRDFDPGVTVVPVLDEFSWPEHAGSLSGVLWYAALTDSEITAIFGDWDSWAFAWGDGLRTH